MRKLFLTMKRSACMLCIMSFILTPVCYAEVPENGIAKIAWAMDCSGPMPKAMIIGFIILAALAALTIYKTRRDNK